MLGAKIVLGRELQHSHVANSVQHASPFTPPPTPWQFVQFPSWSIGPFKEKRTKHKHPPPHPRPCVWEITCHWRFACVCPRVRASKRMCAAGVLRRNELGGDSKEAFQWTGWSKLTRQNSAKVSAEQFKLAGGKVREREGAHVCECTNQRKQNANALCEAPCNTVAFLICQMLS